ncbi:hypothetical protein EKH55_1021 [Sinorhizobium alkalisoli]|nr:hypothetical protein EKH55_1021 [Sinorhizobium alkalisoli]
MRNREKPQEDFGSFFFFFGGTFRIWAAVPSSSVILGLELP